MTSARPGNVRWLSREPPLTPIGCAFFGAGVQLVLERLLARDDADLRRLSGVGRTGLLVLLGTETDLPWADGIVYLGAAADAPLLLMPTTLRPSAPEGLVYTAARRAVAREARRFALLPDRSLVIPLDGANPLERAALISRAREVA